MLLVGLALVGTGLGLFTPANNAAIMASAPKDRAGVAAGVLNMARGLGTALGLALTGLVYGLAPTPRDGFQVEMVLLAAISAAALVLAAARRERPHRDERRRLPRGRPVTASRLGFCGPHPGPACPSSPEVHMSSGLS